MFNKSISSKRKYGRKLAAIFMAGMIMLTGCGNTGDKKKDKPIPNENPEIQSTEIQWTDDDHAEEQPSEKQHPDEEYEENNKSEKPVPKKAISDKAILLGANMEQGKVELPSEDEEKKFIDGTTDFSFEIMKKILEKNDGKNIMISPVSIINALAMVENGAAGKTLTDMEAVVGRGMTRDEYNRALSEYCKSLYSEDATFSNANSVWIKDDVVVQDPFVQNCKNYYNSEIYKAPFDKTTINDINNWGYNNTNGLIDNTVDDMKETDIMFLVNAIYFEAKWKVQYEEKDISENRVFTDKNGNKDQVTMLVSEENDWFKLNGGTGFIKPYKGDKYSFVGILPGEGKSPEEYMSEINGSDFANAIANQENGHCCVEIPEFSADYKSSLREALIDMGMGSAFENADFSEMFDLSTVDGGNAKIGDVIHNTHIDVDRNGTKAAAITKVEMVAGAAMVDGHVVLDRPFVYMIIDNDTNMPVFMGICNDIVE